MKNAPERICLDLDLGFEPYDDSDFKDLCGVTWSKDDATGRGIEYVRKSYFDRVVEELTKWNTTQSRLPELGVKMLVRFKNGNWSTSERYTSPGSGKECWKGSGSFTARIIEWRYV